MSSKRTVLGRALADPLELVKCGIPYEMSDVGAAERFVFAWHGLALWCPEMKIWMIWNGKVWVPSNERAGELAMRTVRAIRRESDPDICPSTALQERIFKFALRCEQAKAIAAILRLARDFKGMSAKATDFDNDPWLLNVANGVIDLRSGKLLEHSPDLMMRKISRCKYEPGFTCSLFETFIRDATNGDSDLTSYIQRAVGYSLTGFTSEKCLFFIFSTAGNTGKSCLLNALQSVLGEGAVTLNIEVFGADARDKYDLAKLQGARVAALSEIEEGKKLSSSLLKRVTGDDLIRARDCGEKSIEFKPKFKVWMIANHAPVLSSTDEALWNRVKRIPFNHEVPKERRDVRIIQAASDPTSDFCKAFLAWAVKGCLAWQQKGTLGTAAAVEASTSAYREEMNPMTDFFEEYCQIGEKASCQSSVLYHAYLDWTKAMNMKPAMVMNMKTFRLRMEANGFSYHRQSAGMFIKGIELKASDELPLTDNIHDEMPF